MSSRKNLSVYFYKFFKSIVSERKVCELTKGELAQLFEAIEKLPIDLGQGLSSRYANIGTGEETFLVLKGDKVGLTIPNFDEYVSGLFFKRRSQSYPYDDDGKGSIQPLKLSHDDNEIAEVTGFLVDQHTNILCWVNTKYVGRVSVLESYLNEKMRQAQTEGLLPNQITIDGNAAEISIHEIVNPKAVDEFTKNMSQVSAVELKVVGDFKSLEKLLHNNGGSTYENMQSLLSMGHEGNAATLKLILSVEPRRSNSIDKNFILRLFKSLIKFKNSDRDKLEVRGKIGETSRTINLLSDMLVYRTSIYYDGKQAPIKEVFAEIYKAYLIHKNALVETTEHEATD